MKMGKQIENQMTTNTHKCKREETKLKLDQQHNEIYMYICSTMRE